MNARASSHPLLSRELVRGFFYVVTVALLLSGCVKNTSNTPIAWNLTPGAEETYGTLLLEQSIRNEDHEGILEAVTLLLPRENRPQPFVDAAAALLMGKQNTDARRLLEKAVQRFPSEFSLHLLLAEVWVLEGKSEQAIQVIKQYQIKYPKSEVAKQELAILYVKAGRYAEANRLFYALPQRLRSPYVRYCHAQALIGLSEQEKGKDTASVNRNRLVEQAIVQLRAAVQENSEFLEAWFELAKLLERQKDFSGAAAIYADLLEQDFNNQDIRLRLSGVMIRAGNPAKALEMVLSSPDSSSAFLFSAVTLFLEEKEFRQAQSLLDSIAAKPGAPAEIVFYRAAIAYEFHKDVEETLRYLASVPEGSRFYDRALRLRAQLYYDQNQPDEALAVVRQGKEYLPGDREFRQMEIHLLITTEAFEDALAAVDEAISIWPDDEEMMYLRGTILDSMERKSEALIVMEDIIDRNPDAYRALNYIGYALSEQGRDLDRAMALLGRANQLQPNQSYILDSLAWAQYQKKMYQEAWKNIRRAVSLPGGEETVIWEHYGDIAFAVGDRSEARRGWNRSLSLNPEQPETIRTKLDQL